MKTRWIFDDVTRMKARGLADYAFFAHDLRTRPDPDVRREPVAFHEPDLPADEKARIVGRIVAELVRKKPEANAVAALLWANAVEMVDTATGILEASGRVRLEDMSIEDREHQWGTVILQIREAATLDPATLPTVPMPGRMQ